MSDIVIGIDLGTTNSLVAYSDERGPRIITGPDGQRILPSVVYIDPITGEATIGDEARQARRLLPHELERGVDPGARLGGGPRVEDVDGPLRLRRLGAAAERRVLVHDVVVAVRLHGGRRGRAEGLLVYGTRIEGTLPDDRALTVDGVDPQTVLDLRVEKRGDEYWALWGGGGA